MLLPNQLSSTELKHRDINLSPVLLAQQCVLFPLYFFLPLWIVAFNIALGLIVYFKLIKQNWSLPTWLKVSLTLIATTGVLLTFHRLAGRDAGVALIAIMYGLKILEIKTHRDVYLLTLLGFFVLLAGFLFSQSPLIALYQVIPIAAIFNCLTDLQTLHLNQQFVGKTSVKTIKYLSKYLVLALPMMLILFVFFPRLSGPIWKMPGGTRAATGVSDTMSPGSVSGLQLSEEVAFRVKFSQATPATASMYWRTLVLDDFDGFSWGRTAGFHNLVKLSEVIAEAQNFETSNNFSYEISLEKTRQKWLTLLETATKIPSSAAIYNDFSTQVRYRISERIRYKGQSQPGLKLINPLTAQQRIVATRLPLSGNQGSKQWAVAERRKHASDKDYILAILSTINQQPYYYTLSPPIMDRDTIDSFWLQHKQGFCEHYSGALVFLARAAGIPARVVVGYQGAEKNPMSDYWIVRQSNAHAWTEIWFENEGWVRVDPTAAIAPHRVEDLLQGDYRQRDSLFDDFGFGAIDIQDLSLLKRFQFWMDQANTGWNDWVLDYGRDKQQDLLKGLGLSQLNSTQVIVLMFILLAVFLLWVSWRWLGKPESKDIISQGADILIQKLHAKGIEVRPSMGLAQLVKDLRNSPDLVGLMDSNCRNELIDLINEYLRLRYSNAKTDNLTQKDFRRRAKAISIRTLNHSNKV
jgi:protein-glutamine gamma-glutamyltransferase